MATVVFHVPEVDTEIGAALAREVTGELALMPDSPGVVEARQARELIEQALAGAHRRPMKLSDPEHLAVLRALDNLRRRGKMHRDLQRLRDRLLASGHPCTFGYSVCFAHDPLRRDAAFTSYAGFFAVGDRLILDDGDALRVARIEKDAANARDLLVVEPFAGTDA